MKKTILFGVLFVFCVSLMWSQDTNQDDIKVGLVLSGGGAKGFAHIGVLKVLEEANVRVDYIGGTSMGAIVGALYASGYSAKQLDSIFQVVDFDKLIQDELPRSVKSFYEKEDEERYAVTLPFNNFKLGFPSSISKGQNIYNLLARLLSPVSEVNDFSKLPIPFFCIATNIETGESVKLEKGYLPEAILASGAFPSLFQPVEMDEKVLIDGGVVNNYPIDEVRAMGADIIIGVDVQDGLATREELTSAIGVLLQVNNYRTVNDMVGKKQKTDIYIHPNITDFTVVSFDKGKAIIKNGELAGKEKLEVFKDLAKKQKVKPAKRVCAIQDSIYIQSVSFSGNNRYSRAYLSGKLRIRAGDRISFEDINSGTSNLLATGNFDAIRYKLKPTENQGYQLMLFLQENKDKSFLRFGVHYDDLYKTGALLNITQKNLLQDDDITSFDFIVGDNIRYKFDYYVDKGFYISYGLKSEYNYFTSPVSYDFLEPYIDNPVVGVNKINASVSDITNQLYLQTVLKEEFSISVGVEHRNFRVSTETIVEDDQEQRTYLEKSDYFSVFGNLKLDTYDNKYFPKRGLYFNGDIHFYAFSSDYSGLFDEFTIAKAKMGFATPLTHNLSMNFVSEGGFKIGRTELNTFNFMLGGYGNNFVENLVPFYGYDFVSLGGNSYLKSTITFDYEIFKKNHLMLSANIANVEDYIFDNEKWFKSIDYTGYALGYGIETFLGPAEVKYTYSPDTGEDYWFFSVGYWF